MAAKEQTPEKVSGGGDDTSPPTSVEEAAGESGIRKRSCRYPSFSSDLFYHCLRSESLVRCCLLNLIACIYVLLWRFSIIS